MSRNRLARLNADGTLNSTFNPGTGADNPVNDVVVQADGKIVIGGMNLAVDKGNGSFIGGAIARLNPDGSTDTSFTLENIPTRRGINGMVLQPDGKIFSFGDTMSLMDSRPVASLASTRTARSTLLSTAPFPLHFSNP